MVTEVFAMGSQPTPGGGGGLLSAMLPFIIIMGIFYVLILRPQRQKQREQQNMLAALKKGDRVVPSGGLHETVALVRDHTVSLKVADSVRVDVSRSAISRVAEDSKDAAA